jgi:hypothetical protein
LFLATKIQAHLSPFSKKQMANPSPLGVLFKKLCNFKASFLHQPFCKPPWPAPFWALTFEKIHSQQRNAGGNITPTRH